MSAPDYRGHALNAQRGAAEWAETARAEYERGAPRHLTIESQRQARLWARGARADYAAAYGYRTE